MSLLPEKIKSIRDKISNVLPYTLPLKLVLGLFATAIGSTSVLGLLSEFAVYNYALVKGFRIPVEGIPYLRPIVTLISLSLLIFAASGFILVYSFAKSTAMYMSAPEQALSILLSKLKVNKNHTTKLMVIEDMRKSSTKKMLLISVITSLGVVMSLKLGIYFLKDSEYLGLAEVASKLNLFLSEFKWQFFTFLLSFITYISAFRPKYIKHMAIASSLLIVCLLISFMFNGHLYSKFLNVIGFGGERVITLVSKDEDKPLSGKLLIQSNEYYFLLVDNTNVVEFPTKKVDRVMYVQTDSFWERIKK